jgi:hypothetical protein
MARDAYKASGYEVEYTGASKPYDDLVVTWSSPRGMKFGESS